MPETTKGKGEVNELRNVLDTLCSGADRLKRENVIQKREVFRKVINHMTIGMDMSPLFPKITMAANLTPNDLVLKKMMYLFVCTYAHQNPELALLTINLLQKECKDQDPLVRGLALRSLCSLRVHNLLEYVVQPVTDGLGDRHPYVRKTAVLGVLKIYHLDELSVENNGLLPAVRKMLYTDSDPAVLANCLTVLLQVDGPAEYATKRPLYHLINQMRNLSEWAQCQVLELLARYHAASEAEVYDLMNVLEDRMQHTNSAVVLGAVKAFLFLTINMPATHQQVLERVKEPLKTLISRNEPATAHAVLSHVLLLVRRAPFLFAADYRAFYSRVSDPPHMKRLKLAILAALPDGSNAVEVVAELCEYAKDPLPAISRAAVQAIGQVALKVSDVDGIIERLTLFLQSTSPHVVAEALVMMKQVLRRYPAVADVYLDTVTDIEADDIDDGPARAAYVWVLGQFATKIQVGSAPYTLEGFLPTWQNEPAEVRLALLTAAAQAFFQRPPEAQALLGQVLAAGLQDGHMDVHDKALLYTRLLQSDVAQAKRVIAGIKPNVQVFSEDATSDLADKLFEEFNSLSVVLGTPAHHFLDDQALKQYHKVPIPASLDETANGQQVGLPDGLGNGAIATLGSGAGLGLEDGATTLLAEADQQLDSEPPVQGALEGSLLDLDDVMSGWPGPQAGAVPNGQGAGLHLAPTASLDPNSYMQRWQALPLAHRGELALPPNQLASVARNDFKDFSAHLQHARVFTMASGGAPPLQKVYLYGLQAAPSVADGFVLIEALVRMDVSKLEVSIKCQDASAGKQMGELWTGKVQEYLRGK